MEIMNNAGNMMFETTMTETKQGIYIEEKMYKKISVDMSMTCVKVIYIPMGRNCYRRGRSSRAMQHITTTMYSGQARYVQTTETTLPLSAQVPYIQAMQNLSLRQQNSRGPRQNQHRNTGAEYTPHNYSRARQGAIPRPNNSKVMRSSKTTMMKNGPKTTVSAVQTAIYQSGRNTTVRTGEAVVINDMQAPPAFRTSVMTGGSEFTWTGPPAWRM